MWSAPITLPLLDITLRPSVLMLLLAVIFPIWLGPRWVAPPEGLRPWRIRLLLVCMGVTVFLGGRIHFLINHADSLGDKSMAWKLWAGGLHAGGAIAALALTTPLLLRLFGMPLGKLADGLAPAVGVGIATARLGCFLNGCCFGTPCTYPWCISFPKSTYIFTLHEYHGLVEAGAAHTAPIHPLQLYFSAGGLLLTAVALWLMPRKRYDGQVALVVLLLFGITAAVFEFFRAESWPRAWWGPLPQLAWTALAITAVAAVALFVAERVHRRRSGRREAAPADGAAA